MPPAITVPELGTPQSVALDAAGRLYILDQGRGDGSAAVWRVEPGGAVTRLAASARAGFGGDGGPALQASLNRPGDIAVDRQGDVYIADTDNCRVRKVDRRGIITTFAGDGRPGTSGDGGPAARAQLAYPDAMAMDASGNLYVANRQGSPAPIRRITPKGIITTAARPEAVYSLGEDPKGVLYVSDSAHARIVRWAPSGERIELPGTRFASCAGGDGDGSVVYRYDDLLLKVDRFGAALWSDNVQAEHLAVAADGTIYAAVPRYRCVQRVDTSGRTTVYVAARPVRWDLPAEEQ